MNDAGKNKYDSDDTNGSSDDRIHIMPSPPPIDSQNDDLIKLFGGNQTTHWQFPKYLIRCPLSSCGKIYDDRKLLLAHFRNYHAKKTTYCRMCDGPVVCTAYPADLENHYRRVHPDVPFQFDQINIKQEPHENEGKTEKDDDATMDDIVFLFGLGKKTQWKFPKISYCPHPSCQEEFENRNQAIDHFRCVHSQSVILCSECFKPIFTYSIDGFKEHYRSSHPDAEIPYDFNETSTNYHMPPLENEVGPPNDEIPVSNNECNDEKTDDEQNDLITLNAYGITTKWKFPCITHCPKPQCPEKFDSVSAAKDHYISEHANSSILCGLCNRPVTMHKPRTFVEHYRRMHPHNKIPFDFDDNKDDSEQPPEDDLIVLFGCGRKTTWRFPDVLKCPYLHCQSVFKTRSAVIRHYKRVHPLQGAILCKLCNIPIRVNNSFESYVSHFHRQHPFMKIPFTGDNDEDESDSEQLVPQLTEDAAENAQEECNVEEDIIKLTGLGQSMDWRLPPHTTRCPINKCREAFADKSALRIHYQQEHAPYMVLCIHCDKPYRFDGPNAYIKHYRERHPNIDLPMNLIRNMRKSIHNRPTEDVPNENDGESDEENDVLLLKGLGQKKEYRFPIGLTQCPINQCRKEFGIRSAAIDHFNWRHTKNSVFCEICDRPVSAKARYTLEMHYKNLHPGVEPPEFLKHPIPKEDKNDNVDDDIDDSDLIKLTGCGISTEWQFPSENWEKCPVGRCDMEFRSRSDAIIHYKRHHAKKAIMCSLCSKPIAVNYTEKGFIEHYRRAHPFKKIPFGLDDESTNASEEQDGTDNEEDTDVDDLIELKGLGLIGWWKFPQNLQRCPTNKCEAAFKSRRAILAHYRAKHAPECFLCPICGKPVHAPYLAQAVKHFQNTHKNTDIPAEFSAMISNNKEEDDVVELKGAGQITKWRFPQNTTVCPAHNCSLDSGFRSQAISHFRRKHAKDHIFCELCDKIVGAKNSDTFVQHYNTLHPDAKLPDFLEKTYFLEIDSDDEQVDDVITLTNDFGIECASRWRFPVKLPTPYCPVNNCNGRFERRSQAIKHYQNRHSIAILCEICCKPISAKSLHNVVNHYKNVHPDEELPAYIKEKIVKKRGQKCETDGTLEINDANGSYETDESDSDEEDDTIWLTGGGRKSKWRFPDVSTCPVLRCNAEFETRSQTIRHYKNSHSKNFQLCEHCDKPVSAPSFFNFKLHFERMHPNMSIPEKNTADDDEEEDVIQLNGGGFVSEWKCPKSIRRKCPVASCRKEFGIRLDVLSHLKKRHASDHFYCKHCDKVIHAQDQKDFHKHQRKAHPDLEQPSTSEMIQISSSENENEDDMEEIELSGCGIVTKWKFRKGTITKCPVHKCNANFKTHSCFVQHYQNHHAKHAMYCSLCGKVIIAYKSYLVKQHYSRVHPNEKSPLDDNDRSTPLLKTKLLRSSGIIEKFGEIDDMITLEACNQTMQWKFPNKTQCPVDLCRREFGFREDAIAHFKKRHAKNALYCKECDSPIEVYREDDVLEHDRRVHRHESKRISLSSSSSSTGDVDAPPQMISEDGDESDDDVILLSGLGHVTRWKFPLIKYCPVPICALQFGVRSDAINHYRKKHASESICCVLCRKPVLVPEFELHFQRKHPNDDISLNFDKKSESPVDNSFKEDNSIEENDDEDILSLFGCGQKTKWRFPKDTLDNDGRWRCPSFRCDFSFSNRSACRNHFRNVHAKNAICCPVCKKQYVAIHPHNFLLHFRNAHPKSRMPFKFGQEPQPSCSYKTEPNVECDDENDDQVDAGDDIIELFACGQTTKWRVPAGMTKCPVFNCQRNFEMRSTLISHYREKHARGSIFCKICDWPFRINNVKDYMIHHKRKHPNHKIPFTFNQRNRIKKIIHPKAMASENTTKPKVNMDQNDNDWIELSGLDKVSHWRFPFNLTKCPLLECGIKFKNRRLAIAHYRSNHATTSALCFLCSKPISTKFGANNYVTHFKRVHPHAKLSQAQLKKIELSVQNSQKLGAPSKQPVKHSIATQSIHSKNSCRVCGKQCTHLSRHMMEMHTKKRILCPLKSCDYTSKRLEFIREHWKRKHQQFRFPEISRDSGFTYRTTTDDTQKSPSTSDATSDSQTESRKRKRRHSQMEHEAEHSLLMPRDECFSSAESLIEDDSSEMDAIQKNRKQAIPSKKRRLSSDSKSSSSDYIIVQKPVPRRFKLIKKNAKHPEGESRPSTSSKQSNKGSTKNLSIISLNELPQCSVSLEKLSDCELNKSIKSRESPIPSTSSMCQPILDRHEHLVIDVDLDTTEMMAATNEAVPIPDHNAIGYSYTENTETNYQEQFYYEMEHSNRTLQSMPKHFDPNANDEYNSSQNQLTSTIDVYPDYQVKEEKVERMDAHMTFGSDIIYDVLDSDEEEALNSRDSGRETNDTVIDMDSSHIPTMGVLMMAKK